MSTTTTRGRGPAGWVRAMQIGIGAIAIVLSITAIIYPVGAVTTGFLIAGIILLLLGIEQVVAGIFLYRASRFRHVGLGLLAIILASIVIAFPQATSILIVYLAGFALLFIGLTTLISGIRPGRRGGRVRHGVVNRSVRIIAGAIALALSIAVLVSPMSGVKIAGVLIGFGLLVCGIGLVIAGIFGRRTAISSATDVLSA